jgi:hypothetical protein
MSPLEFMRRLAARVPRPRLHLIRVHGVLVPDSKLDPSVVPVPAQTTTGHAGDYDHAHAYAGAAPLGWTHLLKRVFNIDIERCAQRGGHLKIIAAIEGPAVIECILTHPGLSAQPPPRARARQAGLQILSPVDAILILGQVGVAVLSAVERSKNGGNSGLMPSLGI